MSRALPRWLLALSFGAAIVLGCSDNPTTTDDDDPGLPASAADSVAAHWMQAMSDTLESLDGDIDEDDIEAIDMDAIRAGVDAALALDANSPTANLVAALVTIAELNYNDRIWAFVDSLIALDEDDGGGLYLNRRSPILNNQLQIMATAPRELGRQIMRFPDNVGIGQAQAIIEDVVIRTLDDAIDHLQIVEDDPDVVINLEVDGDAYEIDLGEVYVFDALLHAARAGFHIVTAFDMDLHDAGGSYDWLDDLLDRDFCNGYGVPDGTTLRMIDRDEEEAVVESTLVAMVERNLTRPGFLTRRGTHLGDAYNDIVMARNKLVDGVAFIRGEGDGQTDDVIKLVDLMDIDDDIANEPDRPDFAVGFTTIEDVLGWVNDVLSGVYHVEETADNGLIEFDINIGNFLVNGPDNLVEMLPYHRFRPRETWGEWDFTFWSWGTNPLDTQCWFDCELDEHVCDSGFTEMRFEYWSYSIDPLEFLDGPGGAPIDIDVESIPYMPNYTLGGLFPGATRQTWLDVGEAAGW